MKNKLLLFLLFFSFIGIQTKAENLLQSLYSPTLNQQVKVAGSINDTVKKSFTGAQFSKQRAIIPPPLTTAGSACKEENSSVVEVVMAASGGSGDLIEWFDSQTSNTVLFTGSIYRPSISQTKTYYVWSHSGADFSIRVPVVASVYDAPPAVSLSVAPNGNSTCEDTLFTFTANGGGDFFEFSVDGVVVKPMSADRTFETNTLKRGQVVSVRTRFGVSFDGLVNEKAWGTAAMEDNVLSAPLSPSAANAYINSIKISSTEQSLVFGMAGKLEGNGNILLFLDTKPGGFNTSSFGDVVSLAPTVRGFNFFNNNSSTFDSYFEADYCVVVARDASGTSFIADVIELKTGTSNISGQTTILGQDPGNSGIGDYDLGFEVSVLKTQIGYNQGDIKFFAFTMKDDIVTNSFLSPELNSSSDYGNGSIDFRAKDPNPVVVSADALIPCYNAASIAVTIDEKPTPASVGPDQINCILTSGSLGGNTPVIGSGAWSLSSGPGRATFSDASSGSSTVTADTAGSYVFTWTISNGVCPPSKADIKVEFSILPVSPSTANQTECAEEPIQKLTAIATAGSGETIKWYDASVGGNVVTDPSLNSIGTITYYAEAQNSTSFCVSSARTPSTLTINARPSAPTSGGDQTECAVTPIQTLTATATAGSGETVVWYSAASGGSVVANPILSAIGTITYYAESINTTTNCSSTSRVAVTLTINPKPPVAVSGGDQFACVETPIQTLTATAFSPTGESVKWYTVPSGGTVVSDPTLNSIGTITYYADYVSASTNCPTASRTPVTLTIIGVVPNPSGANQTECSDKTANQTLTATATGNTITWYSNETGGSIVANPIQVGVGTATYYAESSIGQCKSVGRTAVTLTITSVPETPTVVGSNMQPTCLISTGEITIASQSGVEYSIGNGFQDNPVFSGLVSGNYTIRVRFKNNTTCEVTGTTQTINPIPAEIQFEIVGECINQEYVVTASPLGNSFDPNNVDYQWKDSLGNTVGTNSNILNISDLIASTSAEEVFPLSYTLTIVSNATGCETSKGITVETIYCNIQKGISPDGNGSNDFFDLRLLPVGKLAIFSRYGIKVYEQFGYRDQWKGQSDKGENLPSGTYYYVIELTDGKGTNKVETKTGWIYLIR